MFKNIISIFLISIFLISTVFAQDEETQTSTFEPLQFEDDTATLDEPAMINGVTVSSAQATPSEITKNDDGTYDIDNGINIHGIVVQNVEKSVIEQNSISGIAGSDSIVGKIFLDEGTKFIYNKDTKEVTIEEGGSVYVSEIDESGSFILPNIERRVLITAENGEITIPAGGFAESEGYIELSQGASIKIERSSKFTLSDREISSTFRISSLEDGVKISGLKEGIVEVNGHAILEKTTKQRFRSFGGYIYRYPPNKEVLIELQGTTEFVINPHSNELEALYFGEDGQSRYTFEVETDLGKNLVTYSNVEGKNGAIFFNGDPNEYFNDKDLGGYILLDKVILIADDPYGKYPSPDQVPRAIGIISISVKSQGGDKTFKYTGLDRDTSADFKIVNGMVTFEIFTSYFEDKLVAEVHYGDIQNVFLVKNGKLEQYALTKTLLTSNGFGILDGVVKGVEADPVAFDSNQGILVGTFIRQEEDGTYSHDPGATVLYPRFTVDIEEQNVEELTTELQNSIKLARALQEMTPEIGFSSAAPASASGCAAGVLLLGIGCLPGLLVGVGMGALLSGIWWLDSYFNIENYNEEIKRLEERQERAAELRMALLVEGVQEWYIISFNFFKILIDFFVLE